MRKDLNVENVENLVQSLTEQFRTGQVADETGEDHIDEAEVEV